MTSSIPFYAYKIVCLPTGEYYFGYRTQHTKYNRSPEQDLWLRYFTSSKQIKQLVHKYGKTQFDTSILFKTFDEIECYWYEQKLIKQHIQDPLCLNYYYHSVEKGHREFRAQDATCAYCAKVIGSGNIHKHEQSCAQNPNRQPPTRPKSPCQFCGVLRGPGTLTNHERSCDLNPNKIIHKRPFEDLTACRYCDKNVKSVALDKHERKCALNPTNSTNAVSCPHCDQTVLKNQLNTVHRKSCSGAIYNTKTQKYKVQCKCCSKWVGANTYKRHTLACERIHNRFVCAPVDARLG